MGDFETLPGPGEEYRVLAHNVAAAHRGKADRGGRAFARHTFSAIDRRLL